MLFKQFFDPESCSYTYLIASGYGREAIIIDSVKKDLDLYLQWINQLNLKLVASLDSHLHADHITASGDLRYQTNCHSMMGAETKAECISLTFCDNETLDFDGIKLKTIYTPGHTNDSYCFLMNDRIFTGDTLLIRGTGRTDFQGSDPGLQHDSIFQRLLTLPDDTLVYPGHDYNNRKNSTIAEERRLNPRLQAQSREEYIEMMNNLNLPLPKMFDIAVPANLKSGLIDALTINE